MFNRRLVRIKVLQMLYAHMSAYADMEENRAEAQGLPFSLGSGVADANAVVRSLLELNRSMQAYIDLQHALLNLLLELRRASVKRIQLQKARYLRGGLEPSENFANCRVLQQYAANDSLRQYTKQRSVGWGEADTLVWQLYGALEKAPFFESYQELKAPTYRDDIAVVAAIYDWLLDVEIFQLGDEQLNEPRALHAWALSSSIFYHTDLDPALEDLRDGVEAMREDLAPSEAIIGIAVKEDLRSFAQTLLKRSIELHDGNLRALVPFLRNWDPSRVAFMDLLVLLLGLTEALCFPEIPVAVTINECIELARLFSTKSSPQFVNGVLDATIQKLVQDGVIVKRERNRTWKSR